MKDAIVQDKIKAVAELSFKAKNIKDATEKEKLESNLKSILSDLKKQAIESFSNESDIKRFLDNVVNLNNYSFNNQCLIWLQNPDAKYVASFKTFSKMGYKVNKDETGMKILIPSFLKFVKIKTGADTFDIKPLFMLNENELKKYKDKNDDSITYYNEKVTNFRIGSVFDASQTNMPLEQIEERLNPVLDDPKADSITDIFVKAIYRDGLKIKYDKIGTGAKGYCDHKNKEIVISDVLGSDIKLKVLIHEYAHALAHQHLENNGKEYSEHREKYETEAESIAYVVSKHLGISTNDSSASYLYSWSKNKDFQEIEDSFSMIVNNSKKIINNFEKMYEKTFNTFYEELRPSI